MFITKVKSLEPFFKKLVKYLEFIKKFRDAIFGMKDLVKLLITILSLVPIVIDWFS